MAGLVVIVCLAGERVAFPSERIDSVVEIGAIVPVPGAAPHVAGLAALRSRVLTVIDCRASLVPGSPIAEPRDALVVSEAGHLHALLVDRVEDVVEVQDAILPPPPGLAPDWARIACGQAASGGDLFLVVDEAALIAGPRNAPAPLNCPLTLCR